MKILAILFALTGMVICTTAGATLSDDANPFQLTIPDLKGGMEMNVEGMLTRPSSSNTNNGSTVSGPAVGGPSVAIDNTQNSAKANVGAGVGYGIPDSSNDVHVQWSSAN